MSDATKCYGAVHIFASDDGENFPGDRCVCGEYTWGEMDRNKETYETLETMWRA